MRSAEARASFEEYVAARRPALLRSAYLLTGNHEDAEDLVQTALIKVVPHWRRISDQPDAYVKKVLVRESVSRWRTRRWREVAAEHLPERVAPGSDHSAGHAVREDLRRTLMMLEPRQRAVIVLRYFEDLTEQQTAEVLGISLPAVKSRARAGLAQLREFMPEPVASYER